MIALDLPGFGGSPMPPWEVTIPAYGRFLRDFCERIGVGPCPLVGNSMGGFIATEVAAYRAALDPATFTGRVHAECEQRYCERTGLDPAALRPLRLLAWLIHSRSGYKQFVAEAAGRPKPTTLRRSLFVSLWEEELRRAGDAVETGKER